MGKKILVVDDDKDLLYGMKVWLRANGFHVFFAMDGPTAIAAAQAERPDLILLDIGLPGGDGYMIMARLRSLTPLAHIPILVMSARDATTHEKKVREAGAEGFFQKPFDSRHLLSAIQKALGVKPVAQNTERDSPPKTPIEPKAKKILIIDDDRDLLRGFRLRLTSCGFDVQIAPDAILAMQMALQFKPDLILLDIGLPGGDGYLTMTRLRSHMHLAQVPIIILTAGDASIHRDRALKAGAVAFFQKPIENQQLLAAIYSALGETKTSPAVLSPLSHPLQAAR
ncbi:MAG: response regulator [Syntrophaceae bacterium]|nr:response regulator [Syntrophaceae bacterium]